MPAIPGLPAPTLQIAGQEVFVTRKREMETQFAEEGDASKKSAIGKQLQDLNLSWFNYVQQTFPAVPVLPGGNTQSTLTASVPALATAALPAAAFSEQQRASMAL
eukprot:2481176-Amphidinium_carterae.1